MDERELLRKLASVEALYAGAGTAGEQEAAAAARERIRARLEAIRTEERPTELRISMPDAWSRRLFVALARRYGLKPYRYPRQRRTTVMLYVPERFVDETLMPEFEALWQPLREHLSAITDRIIREAVHGDTSEAAESPNQLPSS